MLDLTFFKDQTIVLSFDGCTEPDGGPNYVADRRVEIHDTYVAQQIYETKGYDQHSYITIERKVIGWDCIHYRVSIRFGTLGGQGYDFTVTKGLFGLRFDGSMEWIM
ncbi:hypothetical protein UC8_24740 [Roseimaritima ulvae]|uniref:PLAT domain-containing protein n=1 Tax=Roseimaritima ulvae TaxID=980254 RepID=A0A5B9QR94_9BACT|nr:hypothetical protein UC8_21860 [Roseimaritima ulvae]QEG40462.1 hypothetical protein UC8_24740 [Roseimaritima ulvae]